MSHSLWSITIVMILASSSAHGVSPKTWHITSAQDVESGNVEGLSVADDGTVTLAPVLEELGETGEMFVWALAEDKSGRVYAATGNQGRLYILEDGAQPRLLFDSPQTQLQCLAIGPDGNVYAGSVPDGIVYRVTPEGVPETFVHTGETYIWDLEFDEDGNLYIATGTAGVVLKVNSEGEVLDKVLDSRDRHVMSLVPDGYGGFYAGTDGNGLVYHINSDDRARLLFSAEESEIHTMTLGSDGRLYVGAVSAHSPQNGGEEEKPPGGTVYRLEPSGAATKVWQAPYPLILSMVSYDETRILMGVGPRGVLYWIGTDGSIQRVADLGESQPTAMLRRSDGSMLVGMGNSGRVKQLGHEPASEGSFVTDTYDAGLVAQWGRVEVLADQPVGSEIQIESRTGNKSDASFDWSRWQALGGDGNRIVVSPPGRFVQLRTTLTRSNDGLPPVLKSLSVTGQQVNVPPALSAIRIQPYRQSPNRTSSDNRNGEESERPARNLAREAARRTIMVVRWGAVDPNEDKLTHAVSYQRVGDSDWTLLKEDITKLLLMWDTEGAPEGLTVVKVETSDRPSNPWPSAMTDDLVSDPFMIDYTGPVLDGLSAEVRDDGAIRVQGVGRDATSSIHEGAYSIDSDEWLVFFPTDGIFDSNTELFDFVTEKLEPGRHTVVVKLKDANENVGTTSTILEIPER
jgi:hypothetical protein